MSENNNANLENLGAGLNRILEVCVKQNLPEPEWGMRQGFVIVTFKRSPYGVKSGTCAPDTRHVGPKQGSSETQVEILYKPSSAYVEDTIRYIPDGNEYSLSEIMCFGARKSRKSLYYLIPSIEDGAIERKYPDQPNYPRQKYLLTETVLKWKRGE